MRFTTTVSHGVYRVMSVKFLFLGICNIQGKFLSRLGDKYPSPVLLCGCCNATRYLSSRRDTSNFSFNFSFCLFLQVHTAVPQEALTSLAQPHMNTKPCLCIRIRQAQCRLRIRTQLRRQPARHSTLHRTTRPQRLRRIRRTVIRGGKMRNV